MKQMLRSKFFATPKKQASQKRRHSSQGFTLVEVMISMFFLAGAVISIMATQHVALQAQVTVQNTIVANALADQFLELVQTDALRWKPNAPLTNTLFITGNGYKEMTADPLNPRWIPYSTEPVNEQMRTRSQTIAGKSVGEGARYCIFYRYSWAGQNALATATMNGQLIELTVAVVWPKNPHKPLPSLPAADLQGFHANCAMPAAGSPNWSLLQTILNTATAQEEIQRYLLQIRRTTYVRIGAQN